MRTYHDMFRPVYEQFPMIGWGVATLAAIFCQPPWWPLIALTTFCAAVWRGKEAFDLYRFRASILSLRVEKMDADKLMSLASVNAAKGIWLGRGFRWNQHHAEIARQILWRDPREIAGIPAWMPEIIRQRLLPQNYVPLKDDTIGVPWIHGIDPQETELRFPYEALNGHTLIAGTTGAGKTRLYEVISTQIIHSNAVLVIIDPKGDRAWENRVRKECAKAGRRFLYLHPAHPSKSIRLQPLMNWNSISEPASRISQLVDAEGSFLSFAWKTLFVIMRGMVADGVRPNILQAKEYVQQGVEPLLERIIERQLFALEGPNWDNRIFDQYKPSAAQSKNSTIKSEKLACMIEKYEALGLHDEVTLSLIVAAKHPREHYQKMSQVLQPIMSMLGDDELGKILSPDPLDLNDKRPIYDTNKIVESNSVLYVGLDSLSNKTIGSALGSILLADFASAAGAIYNFKDSKKDIYLMIDEAAEVMNEQAIQILNKGRGAGIRVMVATQTIADFDALFGSHARTKQTLGNLNNVICLRVKDAEMAKFIAESFGKTSARRISMSQSTGANSSHVFTEFSGSSSRTISEEEIPLVSPDLLTRLPGLQYFAFLAGSQLFKGRLPLLLDN